MVKTPPCYFSKFLKILEFCVQNCFPEKSEFHGQRSGLLAVSSKQTKQS